MGSYDRIGAGYTASRQVDARIVEAIIRQLALEPGATIADVGAGTGNYARALAERGYHVVAIEPSAVMREQAVPHPRVEFRAGTAEALPLPDCSVAAVINILTLHHYHDPEQAIREMERVAGDGPILFFTFDPRACARPWLADYFPAIWDAADSFFPPLEELARQLAAICGREVTAEAFPLPHDLCDLFFAAGWRRPEIYLDATIRANMSACALADPEAVSAGVTRLARDLASGGWRQEYGAVLEQEELDLGYRFLMARSRPGGTLP